MPAFFRFFLTLGLTLSLLSAIDVQVSNAATVGSGNCQQTYSNTAGNDSVSVVSDGGYCYVAFKNLGAANSTSSAYTWTKPIGVTSMNVLVIGGGGGGGARHGGGGGGGSFVEATALAVSSSQSSISIIVGAGGSGAPGGSGSLIGSKGGDSSFKLGTNGLTALGGGAGQNGSSTLVNGGSGGGAGANQTAGTATTSTQKTLDGVSNLTGIEFGNNGAQGVADPNSGTSSSKDYWAAGGGGGAGGAGERPSQNGTIVTGSTFSDGTGAGTRGGNGGIGRASSFLNSTVASSLSIGQSSSGSVYFSGGGGGGIGADGDSGGTGGLGGGANGTKAIATGGLVGTQSTGGGGGGSGFDDISPVAGDATNPPGGAGGSGLVLVRYVPAPVITLSNSTLTGNVGATFTSYTISNSGATPTSYSVTPSLPSGLSLDTSTGLISGSPSATQSSSSYTLSAINTISGVSSSGTASFTITIDVAFCSPTSDTSSVSGYTILKFTNVGTCKWNTPAGVTRVDYLLIGGGGSGGAGIGGGGGAGEFIESANQTVSGTITVTIGAGGTSADGRAGGNGGNSVFNSVTANGGGGGGSGLPGTQYAPNSGSIGSGGGGYFGVNGATKSSSGGGRSNNGGAGSSGGCALATAGGGGGAGGAGVAGSTTTGGNGGDGYASSITGTSTYYAAGGGGGVNGGSGCVTTGNVGVGGLGGGGNGGLKNQTSPATNNGFDATPNTGSGGGGASNINSASVNGIGGAGGSGLLVIKYVNAPSISLSTSTVNASFGSPVSSYSITNAGGPATASIGYSIPSADNSAITAVGLSFSQATGLISGTPTSTLASRTIRITATNTSGSSTADFTISVSYNSCSPASDSSTVNGYTILTFTNSISCSWTIPSNVSTAKVLVVGGGGGGAGTYGTGAGSSGGGGGGGGAYEANLVPLIPGQSATVTIGAGGNGGAGTTSRPGSEGSQGGDSSFALSGGTISAGGGGGGGCATTTSNNVVCTNSSMSGRNGTAGGSGGGSTPSWNAYNWGAAGTGSSVTIGGTTFTAQTGYIGATYNGGAGPGGGARGAATTSAKGIGLTTSISGASSTYGTGGGSSQIAGWTFSSSTSGYGTGGDGAYITSGSNISGAKGASGIVIVQYVNTYTFTYNYNGADAGTGTSSTTFAIGASAITLPTPTKTGFVFGGWYSDSGLTASVSSPYTPSGTTAAITLYAKWNAPSGITTAPNAPSSVTATGNGSGITLTWSAPVAKVGVTITGYQIEYSTTGAAGSWTVASNSISSGATSYQITGLTSSSSYYTRIAATYSSGLGAYGYPWKKVYGTVTSTRQTVNGVANSIQYETGYGITSGDAYSTISNFTRIRYLMKATYSGNNNYADVDFAKGLQNASTSTTSGYTLDSATNIRIPSLAAGQIFNTQGDVYDMTVLAPSTVSVQNGYGFNGRVEIWPYNYDIAPVNVAATATAMTSRAAGTYDDADTPATSGDYGSFQIHNITNNGADYRQTIFAWNRHPSPSEIGFGNNSSGNSDWTFCANAGGTCAGVARTNFSFEIFVNAPIVAGSAPGAPTGVTATAGNSQASVSWSAPASDGGSTITGYTVTASPSVTAPSGCVNTSSTSCTFTGLTNGTSYTFTVVAINSIGTSSSSSASTSVTPATVAGAPTGVTGTVGNAQVTVSWTAPASTGGSAITGYTVSSSPSVSAPSGCVNTASTTCVFTGLTNGTAYTFTVVAINSVGNSNSSTASSSLTPRTIPGAPTGVTATSGNTQASISWTAPASNGGATISGYKVTSSPAVTPPSGCTNTANTSCVFTGLANGTSYTFTVVATNIAGDSVASSASSAVVPATVPGAPISVTGSAGYKQVNISWSAPTSNGGAAITGYSVTSSPSVTAPAGCTNVNATTCTFTGLTAGTSYTFTVIAINPIGNSSSSTASSGVTPFGDCTYTTDTTSSSGYTLLKITSVGTCGWTNTTDLTSLEFAAVGGGGGAGFGSLGGGGGAGRVIVSNSALSVSANDVVIITVGAGGAGGFNSNQAYWTSGSNGDSTSIKIGANTYTAVGGGGGGGGANTPPATTGSGGGGRGTNNDAGATAGASSVTGFTTYANSGASGSSSIGGGGGGGAGSAGGKNCDGSTAANKTGGCGRVVWGISVAGGGGGWASGSVAAGYGGGAALGGYTTLSGSGTPGVDGTGGGGGGGNAGGSGIVLIRFVNTYTVTYQYNSATGGNTDTSATYTTGGTAITLPTPTKTGYSFGGWYKESGFTNLIGNGGATYSPSESSTSLTIYAKWNASSLTVTFDAQGGTSVANGSTTTGGTVTAPTAPTRAGYTLSGWSTSTNGSTISFPYSHGQTSAFTLYAIWSANSLTITYDSKGGTAVTSGTTTTGSSIASAPTAPTKTGYTFAGWSATDGGSAVTFAYIHGKTADFTMYALWTAVNYTITYSLNGGSGTAPTETTKTIGQTFSVASIGSSQKSGYTFGGWSDGTSTYQAGTNNYTVGSANVVLTAQWNLAVYVVTYNSNSGSGSGSRTSENYTYGATAITLPSIGNLARTGYSFGGWSVSPGVSATPISGTYTPTASITLYAVWNPVTYTITFNSNGGGTAPTAVTYTTGGITVTLPSVGSMAKTGYDFSGWSTTANGTALSNSGYTVSADTTLYAKWIIKTISVTYSKGLINGVAPTLVNFPSNSSGTFGSNITISSTVDSLANSNNYAFAGWSDGTSTFNKGDTYRLGENNVTLTAQWVAIYAVRYSTAGGTLAAGTFNYDSECTTDAVEHKCFDTQAITVNADPSRSGYTFAGWKDQSGASISSTSAGWTISPTSYLAYATWTPINYKVSYDSNGGSNGPVDVNKNIGDLITVENAVTKTGYTFVGWRSGGIDYGPGASLQVGTSAITFQAQWTAINYTLVYDSNGGAAVATPTSTKTYQESFTTPAAPNRDGYTFAGWLDGATTINASAATTMPASNLTLTAQWTPVNYSVTYDANGGTGAPSGLVNRHIGDTFTVGVAATQANRNFLGWYDGTNTYMPGQSYVVGSSNITLTATWSGQLYSITYSKNGASGNAPTENNRLENEQITVADGSGLSKRGYAFGGWEDGAGNTYQPGNSVTVRTSNLTLTAKWNATQYFTTYNSGTNASTHNEDTFNIGGAAIILPTPTRNNFHFDGWYDASSGGNKVGNGGEAHTPTSTRTLYGRWTQNSLVGYSGNTAAPAFSVNVADSATTYTQSATAYGSGVSLSIPAGALPNGTAIKTYITNNNSNASSILSGGKQVLLSAVISWLASDETVPDTDPTKPISVTVTNAAIKTGSALYILNNGVATFVGTATSDGTATFSITSDPEVVIAAVAPGAPTNVSGTAGSGSVSVSWTAPTSNGGAAISGYTVTASPGGATCSTSGPVPATTCSVTGLTNGTAYTFSVTATNSAGTSVASSSSTAVTPQGSTGISITSANTGTYGESQNIVATTTGASTGTAEFRVGGVTISGCASVSVSSATATCAWTPASADSAAVLTAVFTPSGNSSTPSTSSSINVNVGTRAITIDAADKTATYTGSAVSVTNSYRVTSGSFVNGDSISSVSYAYSTANPTNVGTYSITPSGAVFGSGSASNYTITYATGTLTISSNALVVTLGTAPSGVVLGESAGTHSVSATTSPSGIGTITFASTTTSVCTVNSSTGALTILTSGVCTITADNSGDSNHSAAAQDTQTFNVAPIVITFNSNGAGSASATQNVTSLNTVTLDSNTFARSGYTFNGWNTVAGGSGTAYADGASITPAASITLYAQWNAVQQSSSGGSSGGGSSSGQSSGAGNISKPAAPQGVPVTTVGDNSAKVEISLTGKISDASVVVADQKYVSKVEVVDGKLTLTPATGFSGKQTVTVATIVDGNVVNVQLALTVLPEPVKATAATPKSSSTAGITWEKSPNAQKYEVFVNGKRICSTSSDGCNFNSLVGPKDKVEIVALGGDQTKSEKVQVDYQPEKPVLVNRIVGSTRIKSALTTTDKSALNRVIALIKKHGFTDVVLSQVSTTSANKAAADKRMEAIQKYIQSGVGKIDLKFAVTKPTKQTVINNISLKQHGDMANPRVFVNPKTGSVKIVGTVDIIDRDGNVIETTDNVKFCGCKLSKEMPYCDGSHKQLND